MDFPPPQDVVMAALRSAGPAGMSRKDWSKVRNLRTVGQPTATLHMLERAGMIERRVVEQSALASERRVTKGKTTEVWYTKGAAPK